MKYLSPFECSIEGDYGVFVSENAKASKDLRCLSDICIQLFTKRHRLGSLVETLEHERILHLDALHNDYMRLVKMGGMSSMEYSLIKDGGTINSLHQSFLNLLKKIEGPGEIDPPSIECVFHINAADKYAQHLEQKARNQLQHIEKQLVLSENPQTLRKFKQFAEDIMIEKLPQFSHLETPLKRIDGISETDKLAEVILMKMSESLRALAEKTQPNDFSMKELAQAIEEHDGLDVVLEKEEKNAQSAVDEMNSLIASICEIR